MIIGIDLDDVLADTATAVSEFHNARYGTSFKTSEQKVFNLTKHWGVDQAECRTRVMEFYHSPFNDTIKPIAGAQDYLPLLAREHDVKIITSRQDAAREKTHSWLERHFPSISCDVHFASNYFGLNQHTKSSLCTILGVSMLIDDSTEYALECADHGIDVLLFDAPWNQENTKSSKIRRVHSWEEIVSVVKLKSKNDFFRTTEKF